MDKLITEARRILDGRDWYTYEELSQKAQEKALERYVTDLGDWDDFAIGNLQEDLTALGVAKARIGYSGFWSQGDGAHFTGGYSYGVGAPGYFDKDTPMHALAKELQALQRRHFYRLAATITHRGHYQHEMCTAIEVYRTDGKAVSEETEKELIVLLRAVMREVYKSLEAEYNYACGEGAVECMLANEYRFNEDGTTY